MGTRADFYVGRGKKAEWLGSIAWDGSEIPGFIRKAKTEDIYRRAVQEFLEKREDATFPKDGWPWPWDDSQTTDYAYAFDGNTWESVFGHKWHDSRKARGDSDDGDDGPKEEFPDMSKLKRVTLGKRSGMIVLG